ncbi:YtxH domain-containing protein [Bacillus sp. 1P06AnD]|uniref:YtxH domain-containing protein n=1 Tax=Bacillus sp. 1P06AnD TaxID=3132208 RepID=UPI0039A366FE
MNDVRNSYNEGKKSKLWKGILLGALAGAAVAMLDKHTREATIECGKKSYQNTKELIQNPERFVENVKEKSNQIRSSIESITEDVAFITGKVEEFKEMAPDIVDTVMETKEVFTDSEKENKEPVL